MTWSDQYRARQDAEALARQHPSVRTKAKELLEELSRIERHLYWSMDSEEKDGGAQWASSAVEHAHTLLDLTHEYRAVLALNPPLKVEEVEDEAQ